MKKIITSLLLIIVTILSFFILTPQFFICLNCHFLIDYNFIFYNLAQTQSIILIPEVQKVLNPFPFY